MTGSEMTRDSREAELTHLRISELREKPLSGNFDCTHLQATHAYIFKDLKHHNPGQIRGDTPAYYKMRQLEDESIRYRVDYASTGVEVRIREVLDDLGGPQALSGLPVGSAAACMSRLYGDLDYAHGFSEGNSRTLREFTRTLAQEAGYRLEWAPTTIDPDSRNRLYIARDILVLERAYPGLTPEKAEGTDNRLEYEASLTLTSLRSTGVSLENMLRQQLFPATERMRDAGERQSGEVEEQDQPSKAPASQPISRAARLVKHFRTNRSTTRASGRQDQDDRDYGR